MRFVGMIFNRRCYKTVKPYRFYAVLDDVDIYRTCSRYEPAYSLLEKEEQLMEFLKAILELHGHFSFRGVTIAKRQPQEGDVDIDQGYWYDVSFTRHDGIEACKTGNLETSLREFMRLYKLSKNNKRRK
jgi:hypothetical protein